MHSARGRSSARIAATSRKSTAWSIRMALLFNVRPSTLSLPGGAGLRPGNWLWERSLIAKKTCKHCKTEFQPHRWKNKARRIYVQTEKSWGEQEYCSLSCVKKAANPMFEDSAREKVSATLKRMGHKPPVRGGNGKPLPAPQAALLRALGPGWEPELPIPTKIPKGNGYPTCYKVDVGNSERRIAIEVDGKSHNTAERRKRDAKKTALLISLGWSVYRVPNTRALLLSSTCTSPGTLLTSLMGG